MGHFFRTAPTFLLLFSFFLWGIFSKSADAFLTICAIGIHEAGHLIGARLVRSPFRGFRLLPCEARLTTEKRILSYGKEGFVCACGPLFNLLSGGAAILLGATIFGSDPLSFFATVSLSLAALNLFPINSFDGGKILYCALAPLLRLQRASHTCFAASFLSLFSLWCVSVYALVRTSETLSLFLFSATLFTRLLSGSIHE